MIRLDEFRRIAWSVLVACTVAFALVGCEGDDGTDGANGTNGLPGADGLSCWDLNGNGVGDLPDEDINNDGVVNVADCAPDADPIAAAIEKAQVESCATCHRGVGDEHQAVYDDYADPAKLALTITNVDVQDGVAGGFDVTVDFSVAFAGAPYIDPVGSRLSLQNVGFYFTEYDVASGEFVNSKGGFNFGLSAGNISSNGDGTYTLEENVPVDPRAFDGGALVGRLADGLILENADHHLALYKENTSDFWEFGNLAAFTSPANAGACEQCHGSPYYKHGNYPGKLEGATDFTICKACHNDSTNGTHPEWQFMLDNPVAWANGTAYTAEESAMYAYKRRLVNDVHMSHSMEFPYPQSMANCATCHGERYDANGDPIPGTDHLAEVLDNDNFVWDTCRTCHARRGLEASPAYGTQDEGKYYESHRAPSFAYLWRRNKDLSWHEDLVDPDCRACHGNPAVGAPAFSAYHTGYDEEIYDDAGNRYADMYTVSINSIARAGNDLTIQYSATDTAVAPFLAVSFYGWDSKDFIVPSHERDGSSSCVSGGQPAGCRFEYRPGETNPLITETVNSMAGAWEVVVHMGAAVAGKTASVADLIAANKIRRVEVSVMPSITINGEGKGLNAVSTTFDLGANAVDPDWFKLDKAIVDVDGCNACHDKLGQTFHGSFGVGGTTGDRLACVNCHNPTFAGSHLEMASRSIKNYVHAIHSFQAFDPGNTFGEGVPFDAVKAKRYAQHVEHEFPYFTRLACEACHLEGTYNVPDQRKTMPGLLSGTDTIATWYDIVGAANGDAAVINEDGRNIGAIPQYVVGPASMACGGCHRAEFLNEDLAGDLAAFNAHTDAFGTLVEKTDDKVLFGIIEKIMTWFE